MSGQSGIFRKSALDRLSSPEQLDMAVRAIRLSNWLALAAIMLVVGIAVTWAYTGSIPTTASGQGVLVRLGGVHSVVAPVSGVIVTLDVKPRDHVKTNQVIATLAQPERVQAVDSARQVLEEAKRECDRSLQQQRAQAKLQVDALHRQRANLEAEIAVLQDQVRLAAEEVAVDDGLYAKGLITRQQSLVADQKRITLERQIATNRATLKQLDAQEFQIEAQPGDTEAQLAARIADAERKLAAAQGELRLSSRVVSAYSGEVIEVKSYPGAIATANMPLLSLQPDHNQLELLLYVPSAQAKDVRQAMPVEISPATVKREEYGFLRGAVTQAADFPATQAAVLNNFQNDSLASTLLKAGAVTEIRVGLERNAATPSGFQWSSGRGPGVVITAGTICTARIITREQRPINLVFPFFNRELAGR
jgi:HlyD family secretion protein